MKGSGSANDDWDDLDVCFQCAMCLQCKSKGFVNVIVVVDDCLYVAVGGVFAFYDLYLSSSAICGVFD